MNTCLILEESENSLSCIPFTSIKDRREGTVIIHWEMPEVIKTCVAHKGQLDLFVSLCTLKEIVLMVDTTCKIEQANIFMSEMTACTVK